MSKPRRARYGHIQTIIPGERYRIFWPDGYDENGKRRTPTEMVYGTWDDADRRLQCIRIQRQGVDSTVTWSQLWDALVVPTLGDLSERTSSDYTEVFKGFLEPEIGHDRVADTDYDRACEVLARIETPSRQRYAYVLWKKMCNIALRKKLLTYNPIDRSIPLKPVPKRKKHELFAESVFKYLMATRGTRYFFLLMFELVGGMRNEEAVAICSWDIGPLGNFACVNIYDAVTTIRGRKVYKDTKNEHSARRILFAEPFASMLLDELKRVDGPIFVGKMPKGESPNATWYAHPDRITRNWHEWCDRNGLDYVRPGDMRSIYSDWHAEAGTPDSLVQLSMGHRLHTTRGENYQRWTRKAMELVAISLATYLGKSAPCNHLLESRQPSEQNPMLKVVTRVPEGSQFRPL